MHITRWIPRLLLLAYLIAPAGRADEPPLVRPMTIPTLSTAGVAENLKAAGGEALLLIRDGRPVALLQEQDGLFELRWPGWVDSQLADQAFVIAGDAAARLMPRWPRDAPLVGHVESLSPGQRAWIDSGRRAGIREGDVWWQRRGGQPVARYDVVAVTDASCFCRVTALAGGFVGHSGDAVELWPAPGARRDGRASSAVAYVANSSSGSTIWVAAPPWAETSADAQVEFFHADRYIGSGTVERRDVRFWYVRPLDAGAAFAAGVGDAARIRTSAEVRARQFDAHVVARHPEGWLINAGENDGLHIGDVAAWLRQGENRGELEVTKLQPAHAVVRPRSESALEPAIGDAAGFGEKSAAAVEVGKVTDAPHPRIVLANIDEHASVEFWILRRGDELVGLALDVTPIGPQHVLYVLPETATRAIALGDRVVGPANAALP